MKNRLIGLVAILAVLVGVNAYVHAGGGDSFYPPTQSNEPVLGTQVQPFEECTEQNGVKLCYKTQRFTQSTTTPCALKSPPATSTLISVNAASRTATSNAITFVLARSATAFATTTAISTSDVGASALYVTSSGSSTILNPNTFIVLSADGKNGGGWNPVSVSGACTMITQVIQ